MATIEDDQPHEHRTTDDCRRCGAATVFVAPFTWSAERYLQWRCDTCGKAWATPERRAAERRTGGTGSDRYLAHDRRIRPRRAAEPAYENDARRLH